jgi:hypothetical protein
VDGLEGGGGA